MRVRCAIVGVAQDASRVAWSSAACPWTLVVACLISLAGCGPQAPPPPQPSPPAITRPADNTIELSASEQQSLERLADLMRDRLLLMHDVARWKWTHDLPIEDPRREAELLARLANEGEQLGLPPERTRRFFLAQIKAGKLVQQADFDAWRAAGQGPFADVADLATVQRPRIDKVSGELLTALAAAQPSLDRRNVQEWLRNRVDRWEESGLGANVRAAAVAGCAGDGL